MLGNAARIDIVSAQQCSGNSPYMYSALTAMLEYRMEENHAHCKGSISPVQWDVAYTRAWPQKHALQVVFWLFCVFVLA